MPHGANSVIILSLIDKINRAILCGKLINTLYLSVAPAGKGSETTRYTNVGHDIIKLYKNANIGTSSWHIESVIVLFIAAVPVTSRLHRPVNNNGGRGDSAEERVGRCRHNEKKGGWGRTKTAERIGVNEGSER